MFYFSTTHKGIYIQNISILTNIYQITDLPQRYGLIISKQFIPITVWLLTRYQWKPIPLFFFSFLFFFLFFSFLITSHYGDCVLEAKLHWVFVLFTCDFWYSIMHHICAFHYGDLAKARTFGRLKCMFLVS